jgi:hypothetical protein
MLEWERTRASYTRNQGAQSPEVVGSIGPADDARSVHVTFTRAEQVLKIHSHFSREQILERLTSEHSLAAKDDALLFQSIVNKTGGPGTRWAKAAKTAREHAEDPLRQRHEALMAQRATDLRTAIVAILESGLKPRRRNAELKAAAERYAPQTFVTWASAKRGALEDEWQRQTVCVARKIEHESTITQKPPAPARTPPDEHEWLAERYHAKKADLDLAMHVRQMRELGHRDDRLPTPAELVAQFDELRTEIRRAERRYGTSEAKLMAEILYDRGRSQHRGRGIG